MSKWYKDAKEYGGPNMNFMLIGNKSDLVNEREVSFEEGKLFAEQNGMTFIETSAKSGVGVQEVPFL
jgi:GTPase SAR1 family protein